MCRRGLRIAALGFARKWSLGVDCRGASISLGFECRAGCWSTLPPLLAEGFPSAVAFDVEFQDGGVVHQPVDGGECHGRVGEDAVPIAEGLICRDCDGTSFISGTDQFKQDAGFGLVLGDVGEVIENDQLVFVEAGDGCLESEFAARDLQLLDQIGGAGEEHAPDFRAGGHSR
jgi:hypothetical protein